MTLRWIGGCLLLAFFLCVASANIYILYWNITRKGKRFVSGIPFGGGIAGVLGLLLIPVPQLRSWWWAPLVADYGALPGFLVGAVWMSIRSIRRHKDHTTTNS